MSDRDRELKIELSEDAERAAIELEELGPERPEEAMPESPDAADATEAPKSAAHSSSDDLAEADDTKNSKEKEKAEENRNASKESSSDEDDAEDADASDDSEDFDESKDSDDSDDAETSENGGEPLGRQGATQGIRPIPESSIRYPRRAPKTFDLPLPSDVEDLEARRRAREEAEREARRRKEKIRYTYRQEPSDMAETEARQNLLDPQQKRHRIVLLLLVFLLGIGITLVALLPQFYLQSLYISGNRLLSDREIVECAGLVEGKHLFTYLDGDVFSVLAGRNHAMEERFKREFAIIKDVRCQLSLPSGFLIEIEEQQPMGVLAIPGGYAIASADGRILGFREDLEGIEVPLITGLDLESVIRGEKLLEPDQRVLSHALRFLDTCVRCDADANDGFSFFSLVREVHVDPREQIDVSFEVPDTDRVMLARFAATDGHSDSIYWLRHVLQTDALKDQGEGYVDLTGQARVFVAPRGLRNADEEEPEVGIVPPDAEADEGGDGEEEWEDPYAVPTDQFGRRLDETEETTTTGTTAPQETDSWGYPVEPGADEEEETTETVHIPELDELDEP